MDSFFNYEFHEIYEFDCREFGTQASDGYEWAKFVEIRVFGRKIQFVPFVKFVVSFHQISVFDCISVGGR